MTQPTPRQLPPPPKRRTYVPVVGPRLLKLLVVLLGLFAVLSVNSLYLATITLLEWVTGRMFQTPFYFHMHFAHVVLGVLLTVPALVFMVVHWKAAHDRPNRRAVRAGIGLMGAVLITFVSGFLLVRFQGFTPVKDPATLRIVYWAHIAGPLLIVWLFVLHRLAGKRIRWRVGLAWAGVAAVFAGAMALLHAQDPREAAIGPKAGAQYFFPSQSLTATGGFIPASAMLNDRYCLECHADIHKTWSHSAHRFSSFNNDAYLFSVLNTRKKLFERDGHVRGSRFCAGCHDPVPFFSGAFEDPKFDDPAYDLASDPMATAGITCTVCHSITAINNVKGNASYTIEEAQHYPFATSENPLLRWINRQMILSKPEFHRRTFLKPLHKTAEFCASCHKVHLPPELNDYKWLRGQNHYDAFLLSGFGHGVASFYYPPKADTSCNRCHMPLADSNDFGAKDFAQVGRLQVHDHQFPSANTAIPHLEGMPAWVNEKHAAFNEGVLRVDLFGLREGGTLDGRLVAPLRPQVPTLAPGGTYLLETVIRTLKMGHLFTQGTADSNEVWLDVKVTSGERVIGRSGGRGADGEVDPWSHFVNAFVIDREGKRIDRRNAEDIFLPLYNHQIGPGAADTVHFLLRVPEDAKEHVAVEVALRYRKFDTTYMRLFQGEAFRGNDLPILTLATDRLVFPLAGAAGAAPANADSTIPVWQRWNDYGIGALQKGSETGGQKGELRQAEDAFAEVERLGRPDGPLNRARVYLKEGRLDEAGEALAKAASFDPPAPPWSVAWHAGLVSKQNGDLDAAIEAFRKIVALDTEETRTRNFDFSKDYRLLNELARAIFERAKQERGEERSASRTAMLREAVLWHERALAIDPENMDAHYGLSLLHEELGQADKAAFHREEHARYKPDDNAADRAVAAARQRYPAADRAAEAVVIYDLAREGAYELAR